MTKHRAAAYFDLDGTLVRSNLIQPTVHYFLNQASPGQTARRFGRALLDAPRLALAELIDRRQFNELLFSHFRGMTEDRLVVLAEEIFETILQPAIFPGAPDLIQQCKQAGLRVVIITGSLDITTKYIADYLGADHFIANVLEMKDRVATGKLRQPLVAGPDKVTFIVEDAQKHDHELKHCQAYSDSFSDVPMLSVVGQAFCINPDRKLRRMSRAYRWPIIDLERQPPASFRKQTR